jgi:hypothetical protein
VPASTNCGRHVMHRYLTTAWRPSSSNWPPAQTLVSLVGGTAVLRQGHRRLPSGQRCPPTS